ncbi:DUF2255 family protein [Streptomyces sp. NPDC086023]|uniref:DUF2255 family protein n=1 Tax=Streptomyces sp. NPDC086023 TaxID=3365746 RepID=UPI0037D53EDA
MLTDPMEIILWTRHADDGRWSARPVWLVLVDGHAYVRSAFGRRSAWYRRVLDGAAVRVEADGAQGPVTLRPVTDPGLVRRVSDAYRDKYGLGWPGPVESMNLPGTAATTMRLHARG